MYIERHSVQSDQAPNISIPTSSGRFDYFRRHRPPGNIVDLLVAAPAGRSFSERIQQLNLSADLEQRALRITEGISGKSDAQTERMSVQDEKELATEVLLYRHAITRLIFKNRHFRQAAISIIQNIYLFKQRKIFFGTTGYSHEQERQEALLLLTDSPDTTTIPLARTFQHPIIARIWERITSQATEEVLHGHDFRELHELVEKLNTLRNLYMVFSIGLVHSLTRKINTIYKQSISDEDARQIGNFGIARAAYRYHPSIGVRFSTFATRWIQKEVQRQALDGRLIRISSHLVEQLSQSTRADNIDKSRKLSEKLAGATAELDDSLDESPVSSHLSQQKNPLRILEDKETHRLLMQVINTVLSGKSKDVILRHYGLGPYAGKPESVIEISRAYGVTRGSIYQLEQTALKKLKRHLSVAGCIDLF